MAPFVWCPERESNPHGRCWPQDFLTNYSFHCRRRVGVCGLDFLLAILQVKLAAQAPPVKSLHLFRRVIPELGSGLPFFAERFPRI